MNFRKIIFWSHLVVGVATGLVVLVLAATGVILSYETQITRWAEPRIEGQAPGPRLEADALAEAALVETDGQAMALVFENDSTAPVTATLGGDDRILLDPFTGAPLGTGKTGVHRVFEAVTNLHRWLSLTGFSGAGKAVTGVANLGFFFLAVTGTYLWLPKIWRWARIKYLILFRRRYPSSQARDFHWHHIFAFWALIPLVVIIFTGVTLSYDRVQGVVMTLAGVGAEEESSVPTRSAAEPDGTLQMIEGSVGLQAILEVAQAHDPAWRRVTLDLPMTPGSEIVTATVDTGPGRRETRHERLSIRQADAGAIDVQGFGDQPTAARTFLVLRFMHTGEHYGFVGQTIAGLASLAAVFMVYTGLALAWRRLVAPAVRRLRRRRGA